jgi:hypothetical protein
MDHILAFRHVPPRLRASEALSSWLEERLGRSQVDPRWHDGSTLLLCFPTPSAAKHAIEKLSSSIPVGSTLDLLDSTLQAEYESEVGALPQATRPDTDASVAARFIKGALGGGVGKRPSGSAEDAKASLSQKAYLRPDTEIFKPSPSAADSSTNWRASPRGEASPRSASAASSTVSSPKPVDRSARDAESSNPGPKEDGKAASAAAKEPDHSSRAAREPPRIRMMAPGGAAGRLLQGVGLLPKKRDGTASAAVTATNEAPASNGGAAASATEPVEVSVAAGADVAGNEP